MTNLAKDLEFWMTNLPKKLRRLPIIHLAIPGSHDSTTFAINRSSKISPDARNPIPYLKFLEPILRPIMIKWSKTQSVGLEEQLNFGIRYFDLRIATKPFTHKFYFVHNLYSECVSVAFDCINEFLDRHPREIVILDFQHFFNFSESDHQRLISLMTLTFGPKLLPYSPIMTNLTLDYMTQEVHHQVIIIYRHEVAIVEELLWPSVSFPTPWPDTVVIRKLITTLEEGLESRNDSIGFVSQCVLTPTIWYVCQHLFGSLQSKCVLPLEKPKYDWLDKQKPGKGGINIIISDFVEYEDYQFPEKVVNLNRKLLEGGNCSATEDSEE